MNTFTTESKTAQTYPTQQKPGYGRQGQVVPLMPEHAEIAKRAYEIYIKKGQRQGQSVRDWLQAENDLRKEQKTWSRHAALKSEHHPLWGLAGVLGQNAEGCELLNQTTGGFLLVQTIERSFLWDWYYLLLLSYFLSAGCLDGITAVIGVTAQAADWDWYW
jgi:hypothetical protein